MYLLFYLRLSFSVLVPISLSSRCLFLLSSHLLLLGHQAVLPVAAALQFDCEAAAGGPQPRVPVPRLRPPPPPPPRAPRPRSLRAGEWVSRCRSLYCTTCCRALCFNCTNCHRSERLRHHSSGAASFLNRNHSHENHQTAIFSLLYPEGRRGGLGARPGDDHRGPDPGPRHGARDVRRGLAPRQHLQAVLRHARGMHLGRCSLNMEGVNVYRLDFPLLRMPRN